MQTQSGPSTRSLAGHGLSLDNWKLEPFREGAASFSLKACSLIAI